MSQATVSISSVESDASQRTQAMLAHLLGIFDLADHRHDLGAIGMEAVHPRSGIA